MTCEESPSVILKTLGMKFSFRFDLHDSNDLYCIMFELVESHADSKDQGLEEPFDEDFWMKVRLMVTRIDYISTSGVQMIICHVLFMENFHLVVQLLI